MIRPDSHGCVGGAPVDDEPCCPDCGDPADVPGARCEACIEADRFGDIDADLKFEAENPCDDDDAIAAEEE